MKLIKHVEVEDEFQFSISHFDFEDMEHGDALVMPYNSEHVRCCVRAERVELHMDLSLEEPFFEVRAMSDDKNCFSAGSIVFTDNEIVKLLWQIVRNYKG